MTSTHHTHFPSRNTAMRRAVFGAIVVSTGLALCGCGVQGEPVDAAPEQTDCPTWVDDVVTSTPARLDVDADGWRQHFTDRAAELTAIADELPAAEAAVIDAYAAAVRDFGDDPRSPGASRQLGEAAADAAALASDAC